MRQAVEEVLEGRIHYFGPHTRRLEAKLAEVCGTPHALSVGSGSGALLLALHGCGVGPGDEVIMPANVYAAVPEAVLLVGATPVLADIDAATWNLSAEQAAQAMTPRTRALVVQHTYGQPVDMDPLLALASARGIRVIEDGAHALGAVYRGRRVGALGDVSVFAFSNKGISACGVGGAVTTREAGIADDMGLRRYHGRKGTYESLALGYNLRLTEMVAAVASCQLDCLAGWNERRRRNAEAYRRRLAEAGVPVRTQTELPDTRHVYLHFVVRTPDRDALRAHLADRGVETGVHYWPPSYLHAAFRARLPYRPGAFPIAEAQAAECLSLPCNPTVDERAVEYVVEQISDFYRARGDAGVGRPRAGREVQ